MELTREQEMMQTIINKAWEDEAFKAALVADPAVAIKELTGGELNLPEGKQLVVRDQTSEDTIYINIPAPQQQDDVELNEAQLEAVAGGKGIRPVSDFTLGGPKPSPWTTILIPPGDPNGKNPITSIS